MNWYKLSQVKIHSFYEDSDDFDEESDAPEAHDVYDGVQGAFDQSGIRIMRNKRISQVATKDGTVIGGVVSAWEQDSNYKEPVYVFDFDVAVNPKFRGNNMVGIRLIHSAIDQYRQEQDQYSEDGRTMMRLWVVNRRLIPSLERRFGFEIEGDHGSGGRHMVRY